MSSTLSSWLQKHDFVEDPFGHYTADNIPLEVMQETYLYDLAFEEQMFNDKSVVFLAPYGGGKTFARQYTKFHWEKSAAKNTLVIVYKEFDMVAKSLPECRIQHHITPFMQAVVMAVWQWFDQEPERYMQLYSPKQLWWLKMLATYSPIGLDGLIGDNIYFAEYVYKSEAYEKFLSERSQRPFNKKSTLSNLLKQIASECKLLRLTKILILVDEVDALEQDSLPEINKIVSPLLNNLQLFSSVNIIWKFFLPDSLRSMVYQSSSVRKLRIKEVKEIKWDFSQLKELLQMQLIWASDSSISSLAQLSDGIFELDDIFINFVQQNQSQYGAPRTVLKYGDKLFEILDIRDDDLITREGWQAFVNAIQEQSSTQESALPIIKEQLVTMLPSRLRQVLIKHFNLDELRILCFELDINYEFVPGETLDLKSLALVEYCERHGRIDSLKEQISQMRPNLTI